MKTLEYQSILQRSATVLIMAAFSLALVAGVTGILLSGNSSSNGALIEALHKFSGHGIVVIALLQVVVLFLDQKSHHSQLSGKN